MPLYLGDPTDARTLTNFLLAGVTFGAAGARQDAARIADGAEARRLLREREAVKSRIADVVQDAVVDARTLDRAFFEGLAERVLRVVRP